MEISLKGHQTIYYRPVSFAEQCYPVQQKKTHYVCII